MRWRIGVAALLACTLASTPNARAADDGWSATAPGPQAHLELPLYDVPFNTLGGWSAPSMRQSLALSKDFYGAAHYAIDRVHPREAVTGEVLTILAFDFVASWLPLGDGWLHEEGHRAVMTNREVESYNDIYDFPLFADTVAVSHVDDDDLVRMKRNHPADFVRLPIAGIEAQSELVLELEKDAFFRRSRLFNLGLYWTSKLNSFFYVLSTSQSGADDLTDELNEQDGSDVERRDFTGLDFTAWVYDLHRPDEAYEDRGVHPSGVGIDRYIRYSDLTGRERRYLRLQGYLQALNLLDPAMIGWRWFPLGRGAGARAEPAFTWMASAYHQLTPFGFDAGLNVFLRDARGGLRLRLHGYSSGDHPVLPGLEAELVDARACLGSLSLYLTPRLQLWLQPDELRFEGTGVRPGGLAALRASLPFAERGPRVFVEGDAKTEGWVAGNVALGAALGARVGLEAVLR